MPTPTLPADVITHAGVQFIRTEFVDGTFTPVPAAVEEHLDDLGLSLDDRLSQLIVAHLTEDLTALCALDGVFERKVTSQRDAAIAAKLELFMSWCRLEHDTDVVRCDSTTRHRLATEWLHWMASPIEPGHPLLTKNAEHKFGTRSLTRPLKHLHTCTGALRRLTETHRLPAIVITEPPSIPADMEPTKKARPFTEDEIRAIVEACDEWAVEGWFRDDTHRALWHASSKAAFLFLVFASLRHCERFLVLDNHTRVEPTTGRIVTRLTDTKHQTAGRWTFVEARNDELCPVTAVAEWLDLCARTGFDRQGQVLAKVTLTSPRLAKPSNDADWFQRTCTAADLHVRTGHHDTYTTHSMRRTLPTLAARSGVDLLTIRTHLGHVSPRTTTAYIEPSDVSTSDVLFA